MTTLMLSADLEAAVSSLVDYFQQKYPVFESFEKQLRGVAEHASLRPIVHSLKTRIKDPEHLRDKLRRKVREAISSGDAFDITSENLFARINDLVGVRILHLHTTQIERLHPLLMGIFDESSLGVTEVFARTWDLESKDLFSRLGIATQDSPSLYTSVHYVVSTMNPKHPRTGEFQVRTLAEEIWGEVDHSINYPHKSSSVACREQLMALARVTSSCSRLVDSIFATYEDSLNVARKVESALNAPVVNADSAAAD
jgi:ppGpp synthetase/RelA/SpoT-type nucleotidyltranferase